MKTVNRIKVYDVFIWMITIIFFISIFFLPETIPVHWNIDWEVDRYGSRYELLIIIFLPILSYYGMNLLRYIDPHRMQIEKKMKVYELMRKVLSMFMVLLVIAFYYFTFDPTIDGTKIICMMIGIILIIVGNYLPKVPQNFFLGIKTPWTLSSSVVWRKTHKMSGYIFVIGGLLICLSIFLSKMSMILFMLGAVIGIVLVTFVYSYLVYRKENSEKC